MFTKARFEERMTPWVYWFSVACLIVFGLYLHQIQNRILVDYENLFYVKLLLLPITLILIEYVIFWWLSSERWLFFMTTYKRLLLSLIPPFRIGMRSWNDEEKIWLPFLGYQVVDKTLEYRLEKCFALPMFCIALLILPVLGIEYIISSDVDAYPVLDWISFLMQSFIWAAFAYEFIVMFSVAEEKLRYCLAHWLELAIILLPFLALLRNLRVLQALRLTNFMRAYRLRGILIKSLPILLLFETRFRSKYFPKQHLERLGTQIAEKETELQQLRQQYDELKIRIDSGECPKREIDKGRRLLWLKR